MLAYVSYVPMHVNVSQTFSLWSPPMGRYCMESWWNMTQYPEEEKQIKPSFFSFFCLAKTCFKYSSSHSKIEPGQWIAHQFGLTDDHEWTAKLDWWTQLWSHWDVFIRSLRMSTFQCSNEIALTLSLIKTIVISTNRWAGSSSPPRLNHQVQKCKIIKYKNTIIQKCEDWNTKCQKKCFNQLNDCALCHPSL